MTATSPEYQRGAALFVALIMLLVLTMAAVSGMRQMQLEGRMTGNRLEQQRLMSAADSALREAEGRLRGSNKALNACSASSSPCYMSQASTYNTDFSGSILYSGLEGSTSLLRSARWYLRYISTSCTGGSGGGGNAYLSKGQSGCTYYYEINSEAYKGTATSKACGPDALCLRSTFALVVQ
ncbi:PilX N-terminal domain-containing pilus assembly protein [Pseudomonas sp. PDM13]|uniref:pilus assembly PilX family protein n=1 Tax=Pseudomonas sp. PDM13 TaxID=2769255 RepID=UPI0021E029A4|nr:PilX N-terminal domain-containing pilus assembly protein [Pseudomonas sp. PDM13]MCU9949161.1 PilX N-terminal domain-containing pilus assembly protein [Pseudomonas sp. PDM13]